MKVYMTKARRNLGIWGETRAVDYLLEKNYVILERNVRTPHGEIDIVTCKDGIIVFVEVKTRSNKAYGLPEESISSLKRSTLIAAAQAFVEDHPDLEGHWQIDVIAIQLQPHGKPQITHFENAIFE
jgi:putative endonuclease